MRTLAAFLFCLPGLVAQTGGLSPAVEVVRVVSKHLERTVRLPGEFLPFQSVAIHPKVTGFVETVEVDRGSLVKRDQLLARLVAPELSAQRAEAEAKLQSIEAQRVEAEAKLLSDQSTYQRLKSAAAIPGVVAGNELTISEKTVEAGQARVRSLESSSQAARAVLQAVKEIERYLEVTAPFDGVITERRAHPGTLVGPAGGSGAALPLFQLEQVARLRLVVAVPETELAAVVKGARVPFTVPAYPQETFSGVVTRLARSLDVKTRSMPVELDVDNPSGRLAPGMFPELAWPLRKPRPSLFVPATSVAVTTERTFVIRIQQGLAEWVNVSRGSPSGDQVEVFGLLKAGDLIARRGTDELREGTRVTVKGP